jgi:hypothetical protein
MWVFVGHQGVGVRVRMRLLTMPSELVIMLVMFVVTMGVTVVESLVGVLVFVLFSEV